MEIAQNFIKSGGMNLWTQRLSNARNAKQTCILISGAGASAMFWRDEFCRALIEAGYSIIRFDHRDQGLSYAVDWDTAPYTINELAEDVINIADYYQLEKVNIVGHSMGGTIAQWLAIQYPQRLSFSASIRD
ncbi:MAG: alpha/beta fold hydrolase [Gammaproteobacteria bacterium]|nr:alpha/beta fold hydrolase [Gammaproteobacteria bacterium]